MADASSGAGERAVPWWRFSLKQLLLATALVAVGCVALRNANTTWVGALVELTWLTLAASLLLAIYRDGHVRAFWVGFTVVGWLYLLLPMLAWFLWSGQPPHTLITTRLTHRAYEWLYFESAPPPAPPLRVPMSGSMPTGSGGIGGYPAMMGGGDSGMSAGSMGGPGGGMPGMGMGAMPLGNPIGVGPTFTGPSEQDFTSVSQQLWTLLLALCGGWFAQWLYATRGQRSEAGNSNRM